MAQVSDVKLSATQNTLEVAVSVSGNKVDLKVCPNPCDEGKSYSHVYHVFHQPGETLAVMRLHRHLTSETVTYTVTTVKDGECVYKGNKIPKISAIHKGIAYKINRFLGRKVFRISADEMAHWAKSVAKDMVVDARRHARSMATIK
jgi:hypothetical protein